MSSFWFTIIVQVLTSHGITAPMIRATIHGDFIHTAGVMWIDSDTTWTFGGGRLWLLRTHLKERDSIDSLEYVLGIQGRRNALLRWQIIKGQFYCAAYHWAASDAVSRLSHLQVVPLAEIERVNTNLKAPGLIDRRKRYEKLLRSGPDLNPVGGAVGFGRGESFQRRVFFEIWCRDGSRTEVYVNEPPLGATGKYDDPRQYPQRNVNRLIRSDYHPENRISADHDPKVRWQTVGEWTLDWEGPFYVVASGSDRFVVTDSGRLFALPRAEKTGAGIREVWKGNPVHALIHDDNSAKWFAFTKDEYFEITEPIKPRRHTVAICRAWTADPALATAAKCGRVIRGLPEPKEK